VEGGEPQGFVSVTTESPTRSTKRVNRAKKTGAARKKQSEPCETKETTPPPMNLQYNLTTTPLNLTPPERTGKSKGTKRTKKSTEKEPGAKVTKKRKRDESTTPKSAEKGKAKRSGTAPKRKMTKEQEPSESPTLDLNHPGFPHAWTDEMKEFYGTIHKKFTKHAIMSRQPGKR